MVKNKKNKSYAGRKQNIKLQKESFNESSLSREVNETPHETLFIEENNIVNHQQLCMNCYHCVCKNWRSKMTPQLLEILDEMIQSTKKIFNKEVHMYNDKSVPVELYPETGIYLTQLKLNECRAKANDEPRALIRLLLSEITTPQQLVEYGTSEKMHKQNCGIRNAILGYMREVLNLIVGVPTFNDVVKKVIHKHQFKSKSPEEIEKIKELSRERAKQRRLKRKAEEDANYKYPEIQ